MIETETFIDADTRRRVVEGVARTLEANYVFPAMGGAMSQSLLSALTSTSTTISALPTLSATGSPPISRPYPATCIFGVIQRGSAYVGASLEENSPEDLARWTARARSVNFGFYKVERLAGNVGYLDCATSGMLALPGAARPLSQR